MKKILTMTMLMVCTIGAFLGCSNGAGGADSGKIKTQVFRVGDFKAVVLKGPMRAKIERDAQYSAEVTLDSNLYSNLDVHVTNQVLYITFKSADVTKSYRYDALIKAPSLTSIELTGATQADISGFVDAGSDMSLKCEGSGTVTVDATLRELKVHALGSGNVVAKGTVEQLFAEIAGAGHLQASGLTTGSATVNCTNSGGAEVTVGKKLDATISGSGSIIAKGKAAQLISRITGSGSLKAFGLTADTANITCAGSGNAELTVVKALTAQVDSSGGVKYYATGKSLRKTFKRKGSDSGKIEQVKTR